MRIIKCYVNINNIENVEIYRRRKITRFVALSNNKNVEN
jgi:hypothetical protein